MRQKVAARRAASSAADTITVELPADSYTPKGENRAELPRITVIVRQYYLSPYTLSAADFKMPATTVTTNKQELLQMLRDMLIHRRVEITCDTEYKVNAAEHYATSQWISLRVLLASLSYCRLETFAGSAICTMVKKLLQ
jgi:hypothetical protein